MCRGRPGWPLLLACAVPLTTAGCLGSSRPSRFYTLAPLEIRDSPASSATGATLEVGPVEIPDYVDRQQIVTRTGANELVVAEYDRWGGSLEREISRALVATVADRLASRNVLVAPWRSVTLAPATAAYRAAVSISRFDGVLGQSVVLHGRWELMTEKGGKADSLAAREATVTEKIDGADYEALVAAMQRALVRLGQGMADAFAAATQVAKAP
jgi:uncharacterized lipoprotein YmbA